MNFLAKCFLVFSLCFFMYCFATDPVVRSEPNPLDFNPDVCKCSDLQNSDKIVVGKACMCESTADWPGKVLVLFLTADGVVTMGETLNGLEGLNID